MACNRCNSRPISGNKLEAIDTSAVITIVNRNPGEILHFLTKLDLFVRRETSSIHHRCVSVAEWELERLDTIIDKVLDLLHENLLLDPWAHLGECPSRGPLWHHTVCIFWLQLLGHVKLQPIILWHHSLEQNLRCIRVIRVNINWPHVPFLYCLFAATLFLYLLDLALQEFNAVVSLTLFPPHHSWAFSALHTHHFTVLFNMSH